MRAEQIIMNEFSLFGSTIFCGKILEVICLILLSDGFFSSLFFFFFPLLLELCYEEIIMNILRLSKVGPVLLAFFPCMKSGFDFFLF